MRCTGGQLKSNGVCAAWGNATQPLIGDGVITCNGVTSTCAQLEPCGGNGNNNAPTIFLAMLGALAAATKRHMRFVVTRDL